MQIDLRRGVVPISKAASSIAAMIKRAQQERHPIVITQKGYPAAVLLTVDDYLALQAAAEGRALADDVSKN
jgi:prevent-host-death family protein